MVRGERATRELDKFHDIKGLSEGLWPLGG
jgi:hypothetical protein